jgi:hypothetical protein
MGLSFTIAAGPRQRCHSRVLSPAGLMTILYCLRFETSPTWRARSPYLYPPGTGWPGYTPRHCVPFLSPPTTRRATVEVFEPASTRSTLLVKIFDCFVWTLKVHYHVYSTTMGSVPSQMNLTRTLTPYFDSDPFIYISASQHLSSLQVFLPKQKCRQLLAAYIDKIFIMLLLYFCSASCCVMKLRCCGAAAK